MGVPVFAAATGDPPAAGTLAALLEAATELLTWFISSMGKMLTFILNQPAILMMFLVLLVGTVVAMLFRVWHSA